MSKELVELLNMLVVALTFAVCVALSLQLHYQIHISRLERLRFKRTEFLKTCVDTIRAELRRAGFYELRNKDDCAPECKEIIHGMRVLCLVFVAADDNFSVQAFQMRCFEGNPVFDDEVQDNETVKSRMRF